MDEDEYQDFKTLRRFLQGLGFKPFAVLHVDQDEMELVTCAFVITVDLTKVPAESRPRVIEILEQIQK